MTVSRKIKILLLVSAVAVVVTVLFFLLVNLSSRPTISLSPRPLVSQTAKTIQPSPTKQFAKSLTDIPILYPNFTWTVKNDFSISELENVTTNVHSSYQGWEAVVSQESGEADLYQNFHNNVYAYYKKELGQIGWTSSEVADGVNGGVRRITGVLDNKSREIILEFKVSNQSGCGSGGCVCPCTYAYNLYLSSIDQLDK